jgi:hypothetical protein
VEFEPDYADLIMKVVRGLGLFDDLGTNFGHQGNCGCVRVVQGWEDLEGTEWDSPQFSTARFICTALYPRPGPY